MDPFVKARQVFDRMLYTLRQLRKPIIAAPPQFAEATLGARLLWPIDTAVWAVHRAEGLAVQLWALLPWLVRPLVIRRAVA